MKNENNMEIRKKLSDSIDKYNMKHNELVDLLNEAESVVDRIKAAKKEVDGANEAINTVFWQAIQQDNNKSLGLAQALTIRKGFGEIKNEYKEQSSGFDDQLRLAGAFITYSEESLDKMSMTIDKMEELSSQIWTEGSKNGQ